MLLFSANRGAAANVAYAHHNSNRNVFDEWVFSCKRANPFTAQNGKQAESFRTSPPVSSLKGYLCSLNSKIFEKLFELFHGDVYAEFYCPLGASLYSCDLLIGQTLKVVEDQPPLLYFGKF